MKRECVTGRRRGPRWAVAALLLGLAGCGVGADPSQEGHRVTGPVQEQRAGTPLEPAITRSLPGTVYSMAYDPARNALWYAVWHLTEPLPTPVRTPMNGTTDVPMARPVPMALPLVSAAVLFEASAETGQVVASFPFKNPVIDSGLGDAIRVAPDGSVWIAESHALIRVDPSSGNESTISLPSAAPGAVKTPADRGSYATSLTFTNSSVMLARNDVPYLQQWSLSMKPLANVPLPAGVAGPTDMTATSGGIAMKAPFAAVGAVGSVVVGGQILVKYPAGTGEPLTPSGAALEPQYLVVRPDGETVNLVSIADKPLLTVDFGEQGAITWQPASGPALSILWPSSSGEVRNPLGQEASTASGPQVTAAVLPPNGTLWIVGVAGSSVLLQEYRAPFA
jgi:hypothetical protein